MDKLEKKAILLESAEGIPEAIKDFFIENKEMFDAVMLPMQVPSKDSYAWILSKEIEYIKDSTAIAPIMPVNAAKAIKRLTRKGSGDMKVAVLIRPCEVRAAIELVKLNQINLENVTVFSYDCPGAIPMQAYIADPEKGEKIFSEILEKSIWCSDNIKPVCKFCEDFYAPASDLHFGFAHGEIILSGNTEKGLEIIGSLKNAKGSSDKWQKAIDKILAERSKNKETRFKELKPKVKGFDALLNTFTECIGCHNCQSACPICYCRQCYFDTSASKPNSDIILMKSEKRGGVSLPLDRVMFHTGRMSHMSLSCVSCGLCSDACPVGIPVAEIFSFVGADTQAAFSYKAGASTGDALPLREYKADELDTIKDLIKETESGEAADE